jgi:hypothetical protein
MKHVVGFVRGAGLCALVLLFASGCQGSHQHTATEPVATLAIANLKTANSLIRYANDGGEIPLSFDFVAPDGDVSQVLLSYGETTETTPARGVAGQTSGTISYSQSVHLPDPNGKRLAFTLQVVDVAGHRSNILGGSVEVP